MTGIGLRLFIFMIFTLVVGVHQAHASCRYPVADGGESNPNNPNIIGSVVEIKKNSITLHTNSGLIKIEPPQSGVYYTAFGGDERIDKLKKGLVARAWYVGCKLSKNRSLQKTAYLEVYSNDPNDRPPESYYASD